MTRDLHTSEPQTLQRMFENIERSSMGWNLPEQPAGSSSRSGRNRGAAVESDAIGEQQLKWTQSRGAAVEADAIGEQQLKPGHKQRAAAEADASVGDSSLCPLFQSCAKTVKTAMGVLQFIRNEETSPQSEQFHTE